MPELSLFLRHRYSEPAPAVVSTFIGRLDGKNFGKLLLRVS
jgi:NADPH-dependent curcumin reductase CurA